jgi:hypothetical protein
MNNIELFKKQGYCIVRSAVSAELRDFITQYALFDEMQDYSPDAVQVPNAHAKYADPAMETMLIHLKSVMEENTGLNLDPTYSFYRVYRDDDKLDPHTDRPSCEISATLCFNYSYDADKYQWPIFMEGSEVNLMPGDLVIYRGCDLKHWREEFKSPSNDSWHVQGFFHYVDQDGPFADYKNDKRQSVGLLRNTQTTKRNSKSYIQYTKGAI